MKVCIQYYKHPDAMIIEQKVYDVDDSQKTYCPSIFLNKKIIGLTSENGTLIFELTD